MNAIIRILRDMTRSKPRDYLPAHIFLPALEEGWAVRYRKTGSSMVQVRCNGTGVLYVTGRISDYGKVNDALKRWLSRQARKSLVPWLDDLSVLSGLPYSAAAVRGQKTRWASCSSRKNINLNYKLLFLTPDVVRYILHHELCHTVHQNHSTNFWSAVASLEPGYRYLNGLAKRGMEQVPGWLK